MTPQLCRAARGYLGWPVKTLAKESGIGYRVIETFEQGLRKRKNEELSLILFRTFRAHGVMVADCGIFKSSEFCVLPEHYAL